VVCSQSVAACACAPPFDEPNETSTSYLVALYAEKLEITEARTSRAPTTPGVARPDGAYPIVLCNHLHFNIDRGLVKRQ
jgi:hypothetical protein